MSLTIAERFRRLMGIAMVSGAAAGLVLFLIQMFLVVPLIRTAEMYERAETPAVGHHADGAWKPAEGLERIAHTGLGTVLTGIGFGAVLLGVASLVGFDLDVRRGILLGAAGFLCFGLAPAIGVVPRPPGVPGPDLRAAQSWWALTVVVSAIGLWLLARPGQSKRARGAGLMALAVPHLIGAPAAPLASAVPHGLAWRFAATAIATQAIFWLILGALGGWATSRSARRGAGRPGGADDRA